MKSIKSVLAAASVVFSVLIGVVVLAPTSQAAVGRMPDVARSERPAPIPSYQIFDFQVNSGCKGCISFSHFWGGPGFPRVNGGFVRFIRLYWSNVDFESVSFKSPYIEMWLGQRPDGSLFVADSRLGNQNSGERFYFRAALVDGAGRILHFMTEDEVDINRHSVVVR